MRHRIEVPEPARGLCDLAEFDYADAFAVDNPGIPSPREWLAGFFADHRLLAAAVPAVHRHLLGMRLTGPQETYGWRIEREGPTEAVLAAEGRLMSARVVAYSTPDRAVFATFVGYRHPATRIIWAATAIGHRAVARRIVARAGHPAGSESQDVR